MHMFDLALVNAWILYRQDRFAHGARPSTFLKLLDFRMAIAEHLIAIDDQKNVPEDSSSDENDHRPMLKRKRTVPIPSQPRRLSGNKHLPEVADIKNSMRCRNADCSAKSKVRCMSCDVFLCLSGARNCFAEFHSD